MKNLESKLQIECVKWFSYAYPQFKYNFFAIPNGGKRSIITARIMKMEGVTAGVADLFLAVPCYGNFVLGTFKMGLFIEMKYEKGKQSDEQRAFQLAVEVQNYKYIICRSFDEFKLQIESYLTT